MKVAVIGAGGYTGLELLRILRRHPHCEVAAITATEKREGASLGESFPALRGLFDLNFERFNACALAERARVAFVCLPHGHAAPAVAALLGQGVQVLDLSADFRLRDPAVYEKWYGAHGAPDNFGRGVYGLPEVYADALKGAELVAVPGCYPTAALLPTLPFLRAGVVSEGGPVLVDAKSGVSGAGRKLDEPYLLAELDENVFAYQPARHRHTPEIEQELQAAAGHAVPVTFVPQLLPLIRGIAATAYLPLQKTLSDAAARDILAEAYRDAPFVRVLPEGETPQLANVRGSNFCDVSAVVDARTNTLVVLSALDNLVKGAGGQAVQCLNLARGFDERTGLEEAPLRP